MSASAPPLDYTIAEGGTVSFAGTGHVYLVERTGGARVGVRLVAADGRVLQIDTLDVRSETARQRFVKSLAATLNGHAGTVARELKTIAADLDAILPPELTDSTPSRRNQYRIDESGIWYERTIPNVPAPIISQIANFGARIVVDITVDDGTEERREFRVDAWEGATRRTIDLTVDRFASLKWAMETLGAGAVVFPGASTKEHVLAAIQLHSDPDRQAVFGHTGWRTLDNGTMGYLSASGAITGDGLRVDVSVQLPSPLDAYILPPPPAGDELREAVRALLAVLGVATRSVTVPLVCALLRSVYEPADFVLFIKGATGQGKTQIAALIQQCFGSKLNAEHLPSNFSSTGNAIEMTANLAKDAVLVVDDFQRNTAVNADAIAERIGRAVGNQSGRARLTQDARLRRQRPPRGTVIMTGEDIPKGESLRARMSIVEMPRNAMRWDLLTEAQQRANAGLHASALAAFVQWIARSHGKRLQALHERVEVIRREFHTGHAAHPKTINTAAHLMAAWVGFTDFLEELEVLPAAELTRLNDEVEIELRALIGAQAAHLVAANPVDQFMHLLESSIASGAAHLANPYGEPPADAISWGWMKRSTSDGFDWIPRGKQIGWVDKDEIGVYLDFTAAFQLIQQQAVSVGNALPLTELTLLKRINDAGLLLSAEKGRDTLKVRRKLQGHTRNVVHLAFPPEREGETA